MSLYATQDEKKQAAAKAALKHLPKGGILGVGTGSTVNFLIDLLPELQLEAAVASSNTTAERLKKIGIEVVDMNWWVVWMLMWMVLMKLTAICI